MNEVQKFFDGLTEADNTPADIFAAPTEGASPEIPAKDEDGDEPRKNRKHRRLEQQLAAERENNRAIAESNKKLAEALAAKGTVVTTTDAMPAEWVALFGDDENAQKAWRLNQKMISDQVERVKIETKTETLAEIEARQRQELDARQKVEQFVDSELEAIEDQFDVDLTSDAPAARKARKEFLDMVQKFSPKDSNGNVIGYADFSATFETYQASKSQATEPNRNKEIASKSMQKSAPTTGTPKAPTPGFFGWQKDLNLN